MVFIAWSIRVCNLSRSRMFDSHGLTEVNADSESVWNLYSNGPLGSAFVILLEISLSSYMKSNSLGATATRVPSK